MVEVRERILATIYEITKPAKPDLSDQSKSLLAGTLDSLDFASVLMALEDEFGVVMTEDSTEELASIDQLAQFISAKLAA
jgi:acyl carrier protein